MIKSLLTAVNPERKSKFVAFPSEKSNELQERQKQAAENSKDKTLEQDFLNKEQEKLNNDFQNLEDELNEMQNLNQELERPQPMQDFSEEQEAIKNLQKEAQQNLQENKNKKVGISFCP